MTYKYKYSNEALKLALEALQLNNSEWKLLADSGDCGSWRAEAQDHYKQTNEAITACEQALAAQPARTLEELYALSREVSAEQPAQPAVPDAIGPNEDELPAYAAGWNDCRALMLKGMKP
jgi:hypothetical protein